MIAASASSSRFMEGCEKRRGGRGGGVVEGWAYIINDARKEYYCVKLFLWIPYPVANNAVNFKGSLLPRIFESKRKPVFL